MKYQIKKIKILEKQSIIRSDIRRSGKTGAQDTFHFGADPEKWILIQVINIYLRFTDFLIKVKFSN